MGDDVATADAMAEAFSAFAVTRDPDERDRLIAEHLPLARQVARRFAHRGESDDDLMQVASLALVKAVDRFDPSREVRFTTFAVAYMLGELKRHFRDRGWAIRAPRRLQETYLEVGAQTDRLSQELGRSPTVGEIASAIGTDEATVLEALEAGRSYRTASLDAPSDTDHPLGESLGDLDGSYSHVEELASVLPAMRALPERSQLILKLRFFDGMTQSQIAARLGLSQMQISRLLASAISTLRSAVEASDGPQVTS
jgi:RNA polymerase sigma-B factor